MYPRGSGDAGGAPPGGSSSWQGWSWGRGWWHVPAPATVRQGWWHAPAAEGQGTSWPGRAQPKTPLPKPPMVTDVQELSQRHLTLDRPQMLHAGEASSRAAYGLVPVFSIVEHSMASCTTLLYSRV